MRILVTGGLGFIGKALVKKLKKDGHRIVVIDNQIYKHRYSHYNYDDCESGVMYLMEDLLKIENIVGEGYDLCFHLASLSRIQPSFQNPNKFFINNVCTTQAVCDWAKNHNVKVVYSGSSSQWQDPFLSPYACYKKMGEDIIKLYRKIYGCNFEIARFYNVYGEGEIIYGEWAAVIGKWIGRCFDNLPIKIVGDGTQKRDFTHIDDIVDGLIKIGISKEKHEDAWELGSGFEYSMNEVAEMFVKYFGCKIQYVENQKGNYSKSLRANDDAINRLGWKPKDRLKKYIKNVKLENENG